MPTPYTDPDPTPSSPDEFWLDDADWTPSAYERPTPSATFVAGAGATVARWWDSLLGGSAPAGRTHGGHGGHGAASGHAGAAWSIEPRTRASGRGGLDPTVVRIAAGIVALTIAVPLVLGFTGSSGDDTVKTADAASSTAVATIAIQPLPAGDQATTVANATADEAGTTDSGATDSGTETSSSAGVETPGTAAGTTATAPTTPATTTANSTTTPSAAATATAAATTTTTAPATTATSCGDSYEIAAGDYWIRIADAAGVSLSALLSVNNATVDTALLPGQSICLPAGASTPAPPPTAAPTTTSPSTNPPTTNAPTTTQPPTTTAPTTTTPNRPPTSASEAEAIIRSVWPDELEDRAVQIAWRESRHQANAYNGHCCYGLFQIYYSVHRSWLADLGVNTASDLYDPLLNARAAYQLYQRAGGWGPWAMTAYD